MLRIPGCDEPEETIYSDDIIVWQRVTLQAQPIKQMAETDPVSFETYEPSFTILFYFLGFQ